ILCEEALWCLRAAVDDDEGCASLEAFVWQRGRLCGEPRRAARDVEESGALRRIAKRLTARARIRGFRRRLAARQVSRSVLTNRARHCHRRFYFAAGDQ